MDISIFEYQKALIKLGEISCTTGEGVIRKLISYLTPFGYRRVSEMIYPEDGVNLPAILYIHWYEPEARDSNRSQFHDEAVLLAKRGAVTLLVETMWSDSDWFFKRTQSEDHGSSIKQVIELRQAIDILLLSDQVDPNRIAIVGHDFGAMYAVVMGSVDPRPLCFVLMAGTPRFSDWYLYYPKLIGKEREAFIDRMAELDPIQHVANLHPSPLLFQFAKHDLHVPRWSAEVFFSAAKEPKEIRWYNAGHGLNEQAALERIAWLAQELDLGSGQ